MSASTWTLPKVLKNPVAFFWNIRLFRFGCVAGTNLSIKLLLTALFKQFGLPLWLNYGFVHGVVVVLAYLFHSRLTFQEQRRSVSGFWRFFVSVLLLKAADYGIVVITNHIAPVKAFAYRLPVYGQFFGDNILYVIIVLSSISIFLLRYMVFKNIVFSSKRAKPVL